MTHLGLFPESKCFDICKEGWGLYVGNSLFRLITEGRGIPFEATKKSTAAENEINLILKTINLKPWRNIRHNVVIKATPEKVYKAVTTQEGIESWWCKQTTAKPEFRFVNIFIFGKSRNEMKVTELSLIKEQNGNALIQ